MANSANHTERRRGPGVFGRARIAANTIPRSHAQIGSFISPSTIVWSPSHDSGCDSHEPNAVPLVACITRLAMVHSDQCPVLTHPIACIAPRTATENDTPNIATVATVSLVGAFTAVRNAQSMRSIGILPCGSGIAGFVRIGRSLARLRLRRSVSKQPLSNRACGFPAHGLTMILLVWLAPGISRFRATDANPYPQDVHESTSQIDLAAARLAAPSSGRAASRHSCRVD
jgi:hypothetical protein